MKKLLALLCVLACLITCGCSPTQQNTPSAAVESYIKEEQKQMKAEGLESINGADIEEFEEFMSAETAKEFITSITDFDYKVNSETVDGDKATVNVTITSYDFGSWFANSLTSYFQIAFTQAFSGASEEEITAAALDVFTEEFQTMKNNGKTKATTVDFTLNKIDEDWVVDADASEDAFTNAITGGMVEAVEEALSGLGAAFE